MDSTPTKPSFVGVAVRVSIAPTVARAFPAVRVAALRVSGLAGVAASLAATELVDDAAARLSVAIGTTRELVVDPRIAGWRSAVAACGLKPSTFKSGAEQLARRLLKGQRISSPLPIVDVYCAISALHLAPLGAYDVTRLPRPEVVLRHAEPEDHFTPLAGRADAMPLAPDVVVYACDHEVLCWSFNHRDSARTCLRADTDDALFMGEAVNDEQEAALGDAMADLRKVLAVAGARVGPVLVLAGDAESMKEVRVAGA